jgi:hypothetical protein
MGCNCSQDVGHPGNGNSYHHYLASGRLGQPSRPVESGIENLQRKVRREVGSGQTTKGAKANQAEGPETTTPMLPRGSLGSMEERHFEKLR